MNAHPLETPLTAEDSALQEVFGVPQPHPTADEAGMALSAGGTEAPPEAEESDTPRSVLRRYWGYADFRGIQRDIIDSILAGKDTVGLMPTGGGKSITFQVPALLMEGTCLVITPLIALMKDQVENLRRRGIRATAIHSGLSREDIVRELDNVVLGNYKFLYLSPERLHTEVFLTKLQYLRVSFVAVDEAHCISQWGYDFRPSYLRLRSFRELRPEVPILALTATATTDVIADIQRQLGFREERVFRMSFERRNLHYIVCRSDDKMGDLIRLLKTYEGSTIVYTRSRGGTRDAALALRAAGISALYYHAGLSAGDKDARQEAWQSDQMRVMVATNAFGMGIDKPDVRLVVHLDLPDALEAYFQEAGRAGRDGREAHAILFFNRHDHRLLTQRVAQTFPEKTKIAEIYDDLACYFQLGVGDGEGAVLEFDLDKFCRNFRHFPLTVVNACTILQRAGYLEYADAEETRSRLMMITRRDDLYQLRKLPQQEEAVLTALLRHYSGLFSDYVYIEESVLARQLDLDANTVYHALIALNRARILHYIPRKSVAHIVYLMRRIAKERLSFSPEIYEHRREQYARRINGVLNYCTDATTCRSVQLLRYFDDTSAHACGQCDVCRADAAVLDTPAMEARILSVLADGLPHTAADFDFVHSDVGAVRRLLGRWVEQGRIVCEAGVFRTV